MCVCVSFLSFWIKVSHQSVNIFQSTLFCQHFQVELAPARVTLGVTTFLAIMGQTQVSIFELEIKNGLGILKFLVFSSSDWSL